MMDQREKFTKIVEGHFNVEFVEEDQTDKTAIKML